MSSDLYTGIETELSEKQTTQKTSFEHNKKVVYKGQKDAFVTALYNGKRVYLEDLEKMGIFVVK